MEAAAAPAQSKRLPFIRSYEDIEAFKRGMALLKPVHRCALHFLAYERLELASQIRRASKSVPTNIAEGYGKRRSARHFKAYLDHALGSSNEMIVHLPGRRGARLPEEDAAPMIDEYRVVSKLLVRLIEKWH